MPLIRNICDIEMHVPGTRRVMRMRTLTAKLRQAVWWLSRTF